MSYNNTSTGAQRCVNDNQELGVVTWWVGKVGPLCDDCFRRLFNQRDKAIEDQEDTT